LLPPLSQQKESFFGTNNACYGMQLLAARHILKAKSKKK
jgi:hypothetical protein